MKVRSEATSARVALLLSSALLIASGALSVALAAEPEDACCVYGWVYGGSVEVGGRIFIDRPPTGFGRAPAPDNWLTPRTSESRAKFEEYGEMPPGLFVDTAQFWAMSKNGLYAVDFWAKNVGFNNQSYQFDWSKAGAHYLSLSWDETPHLISTSAKTIFRGVGSTHLTVDDTLQTNLQANAQNATAAGAAGQTARANIEGFINGAANNVTLSTQREKATIVYRNTQYSGWDFQVDYSNEHRTGTRPLNINWGYGFKAAPGFPTNFVEAIQSIDDRTQNASASAQYVGTLWGQRWISKLTYAGSFYDNSIQFFEVENPFCITCSLSAGDNRGPNLLRMAVAPSNYANSVTLNNAVDLPWKNRYTSTVQYNMMRQNDAFVDTATNGIVGLAALPATSANAKVDTILLNNVLTTQLSKDLKSTLRYRYYDVDNQTPELLFTNYVRADSAIVATPRRNLAIAYTKQNASADLNWHVNDWLSLGSGYGWEQYDRTRRDANVTNEQSGKVSLDADIFGAARARSSILYAVRRYDKYDSEELVKQFGLVDSDVTAQMRKFDMANRDRLKLENFLDIPIHKFLTITPNFGLRNDIFPEDVVNQLGLTKDNGWNAGIEVTARVSDHLRLMFSYNYEERDRFLKNAFASVTPANIWTSDINQHFQTYIAAVDWKAIPNKLDFKAEYLLAISSEANDTVPCSSGNAGCTGTGTGVTTTQFPTERGNFQRFSLMARYGFDPTFVRQMGWTGEAYAKLRYIYERNRTENWAIDNLTPYVPTPDQTVDLTGGGRSIFLGAFNPNYDTQIVVMTFGFKW
jgi:MtrB/PioB family decaheme-associated outer membrane protein